MKVGKNNKGKKRAGEAILFPGEKGMIDANRLAGQAASLNRLNRLNPAY
jgi:hypothetical protein